MLKVFALKSLQLWMDGVRWDIIKSSHFMGAREMFLGAIFMASSEGIFLPRTNC